MAMFRKKPLKVDAVRLGKETKVGSDVAAAGDWLVTESNGAQYVCNNANFSRDFEPVKRERKQKPN
jgi:hypothetical protein